MILGGLNQEFHQTPSSKERIPLILSEVGETCAVKCIYSMNKSAVALKLLQRTQRCGDVSDEQTDVVGSGLKFLCEV